MKTPSLSDLLQRSKKLFENNIVHFAHLNLIFSPKIGDTISIEVTSVNDLSYVNYLLTSRSNLILSKKVDVGNKKSVTITFQASFGMVPTAQFVVYYITANGDIILGRTEISVSGLNNFVRIECMFEKRRF